jgi:hypothetical protein
MASRESMIPEPASRRGRDPATAVARAARRAVGRGWRLRIWLAITTLGGLGLAMLPLFGVLGYELALAVAVVGSLAGLDLGAALGRAARRLPPGDGRSASRVALALAGSGALLGLLVVVPPALIAAGNGLRVPTCDWLFGLQAYALMPVASAALGGALGALIGVVGGPRRIAAALPFLVWLAIAAAGLARFLGGPAVFTYTPLVGYFPGNLYDENIRLGAPLLWARLEQLLTIGALIAAVAAVLDGTTLRLRPARRPAAWLVLAGLGAGAIALRLQGGGLGYAIDAEDIQAALAGRRETEHFVIHYARRPAIEADIDLIAGDHELRYAQVVRALGVARPRAGKIHSYYFADRDQKARWMGARDVEMAKPWRREIYLTHQAFPHRSLRHEIAHVIAGEFGDPWFSVAARRVLGLPLLINPGLIEGIAVAADWPAGGGRGLTPHQQVRAMQELGVEPAVGDVFSLRFLSLASARGYTAAGSFMRFLLDQHGAARLQALYGSGGDFAAAYGQPLSALVAAWRQHIATVELPAGTAEIVRERFRRTSVFARPCPHAIAARRDRAFALASGGQRARAVVTMRRVCRDAPDEPRHRLELAELLADGGPPEIAEAEAIWRAVVDDAAVTTSLRAEALAQLGRRAARHGDWPMAGARFDQGAALPVDDDERRQHEAQGFAVRHQGLAGPFLRGYFFHPGDTRLWASLAVAIEPQLGIAWYLRGIQRAERDDHAGAVADMTQALALGLPSPRFVQAAARRMAVAAWRAKDLDAVERAAAVLEAGEQAAVDRLLALDWRQRVGLARTGRLP